MKKKEIIVIVDMQNDFITGVLGSKEAEVAVQNAIKYLEDIKHSEDTYVIFTQDTHFTKNSTGIEDWYYENTSEGRHLPILHCENQTEGWKIHKGLYEVITTKFKGNCCATSKTSFMSESELFTGLESELGRLLSWDDKFNIDKNEVGITIFGLCTDICVISNALLVERFIQREDDNLYANVDLTCIANCCAGSTPEKHEAALSVMESCHIKVVR
jgi:nicotinamidase-related amidase